MAPVRLAAVTNTRPPKTTGDELLPDGSATFQLMFCCGPHSMGAASEDIPSPFGPRQECQLSPRTLLVKWVTTSNTGQYFKEVEKSAFQLI